MKNLLFIPFAAVILSACTFTDDVVINTQPEGANVFVNSELVGQTPMTVELPKDGVYEIRLVKDGYKDATVDLASAKTNPFVKFGPLVDMGYYRELEPAPIEKGLTPDFLPATLGTDAFGDFSKSVAKADEMRKSGKITAEEHSYLIKTISDFYSKKQ